VKPVIHRKDAEKTRRKTEFRAYRPFVFPLLSCVLFCGCGRYADFTLPVLRGGDPDVRLVWSARPDPVLGRGERWDSHDVLNPSVVRNKDLFNFYSGYDGHTWRTGVAVSEDGLRWEKHGMVLEPDPATWEGAYIAGNGSALVYGGEYWYWYESGAKDALEIGLARWRDLRGPSHRESGPVLERGPYMSWDEQDAADPYVIRLEPYFYMYYLGQDRARRQRLGVARSPDGIHWEKLRSNPVLDSGNNGAFDADGLGEPAVWQYLGFYWMLYTGRDAAENRRLGMARSTDGVRWQKLTVVSGGDQPWNSEVMCDPTVLVEGDVIRVWFGGGDIASPDENLHGQIGYGVLRAK
jgi:predicted GH43/DUF377 family glycosyl hydrolase